MENSVTEHEFRNVVAKQFESLRLIHQTLKETGAETEADWRQAMEGVLTNHKEFLEAGSLTQEHYEYVVNYWLDNFSSGN